MDDAIRWLRSVPDHAAFVRDAYLSADVAAAAARFHDSAEFAAVMELLGDAIAGGIIVDVGAGNGIASWAFASAGARKVYAVDPNPSEEIGLGALAQLADERIEPVLAAGERLPLADEVADVVYARQVLHHAESLNDFLREIARILRPGGTLLATREHVAENAGDLEVFLAEHPTHSLTGGENAFPLQHYVNAIEGAGLVLERIIGPWESVINAYPAARSDEELEALPRQAMMRRFGRVGDLSASIPGATAFVRRYVHRPRPGDRFSFVASKRFDHPTP